MARVNAKGWGGAARPGVSGRRGPQNKLSTERISRFVTTALAVAVALAMLDLGLFLFQNTETRAGGPAGPTALIYGATSIWQLGAHKVVAMIWLVLVAAAVSSYVISVVPAAVRTLGLKPGRAGLAFAAAFVITGELLVAGLYRVAADTLPTPTTLAAMAAGIPAVVTVLAGLLYVVGATLGKGRWGGWKKGILYGAVAVCALSVAASYWPAGRRAAAARGPNVLLITIDALRADKVGPRPDAGSLTPEIDRFAVGATTFTDFTAAAPWTIPSLATLHTGLYPPAHCAGSDLPLTGNFTTLAELFARNGYDTGAVVSNKLCEPRFGYARGFAYCRSIDMTEFGLWSRLYYTRLAFPVQVLSDWENGTTPVVERRTVAYLERHPRGGRPFFLWVHFFDPHDPYNPPREYAPAWAFNAEVRMRLHDPTWDQKLAAEALYDGEVRYVDQAVGRILAVLEQRRLASNTIVMISSDHGEEFWEHGELGHGGSLHRELLHIPLIIRAPGVWPAGSRIDATLSETDIFATLCELCNLNADAPNQSRSFAGIKGDDSPDVVFASSLSRGDRSLVTAHDGDAKLIYSPLRGKMVYYNRETDPGEHWPAREAADTRLWPALQSWRAECEALKSRYGAGGWRDPMVERHLRGIGYIK